MDVNPFCNPHLRDGLVLPELASADLDRGAGAARDGGRRGPVVAAFEAIGWPWGGRWSEPLDLKHFSATGD